LPRASIEFHINFVRLIIFKTHFALNLHVNLPPTTCKRRQHLRRTTKW